MNGVYFTNLLTEIRFFVCFFLLKEKIFNKNYSIFFLTQPSIGAVDKGTYVQ